MTKYHEEAKALPVAADTEAATAEQVLIAAELEYLDGRSPAPPAKGKLELLVTGLLEVVGFGQLELTRTRGLLCGARDTVAVATCWPCWTRLLLGQPRGCRSTSTALTTTWMLAPQTCPRRG